jgi:hypothetical protein
MVTGREEGNMRKILVSALLIALCFNTTPAQSSLDISLRHNSEKEQQTKQQLEKLLKDYKVEKWIFTKKILIDEQERIAHSHPVLTLNTKNVNRDSSFLLSTFIHEQIHWFEEAHSSQTDKAKKELQAIFPDAPSGPPEGARDKDSTYLHLIVCYLEYEGMKELVGQEKAKEVMRALSQYLYKWIYRTVLEEELKIKKVIEKYNLKI